MELEIEKLLGIAVKNGASDLHILPGYVPMLRIHGDLVPISDAKVLSSENTKQLIYPILSDEQQVLFSETLELDLAVNFKSIGNFRMNVMHQLHGISGVFRVIPEKVPTFEELGLPPLLKTLLLLPYGLVLVTGPTGSGKSTTLAAMVDYINTIRACHVITIEDPIEFIFQPKKSLINQRQIRRDTHDMATALRSSLRQDPDVILLGEMRDVETMRLALTAAETGHLVMATLHANSSPIAISRMVDSFPLAEKSRVRNLLAECLQAAICQMLVKKIGGGRAAAFEIMLATPAIRHLIRQDKIAHMTTTIQTSGDIGMCTMDQYLQELVAKRIITTATARNIAINQDWFREL